MKHGNSSCGVIKECTFALVINKYLYVNETFISLHGIVVFDYCRDPCPYFDMKQLGADLTGIKPCTDLINRAIDEAFAEGGGTIYFPAGTYLTATIRMKSNITLDIESGATLRFSDRFEDYLPL